MSITPSGSQREGPAVSSRAAQDVADASTDPSRPIRRRLHQLPTACFIGIEQRWAATEMLLDALIVPALRGHGAGEVQNEDRVTGQEIFRTAIECLVLVALVVRKA